MRWTEAQNNVITARGSNLVVSAAAGSGKTAVLVERICSLILQDGADIDRMLICTFTRAAAAEMRTRIVARLELAMAEDRDNKRLRSQALRVDRAQIGTLHGFCSVLLGRYGHVIALEPGFRTEEQAITDALFAQALTDTIDEAFERGEPPFLELADCWGGSDGSGLEKLVTRVYRAARNHPHWQRWLGDKVAMFTFADAADTPWLAVLLEALAEELDLAAASIAEAIELASLPQGPARYLERFREDQATIEALRAALACGGLAALCAALESAGFGRMPAMKAAEKTALSEAAKDLRDHAKNTVTNIKTKNPLVADPGALAANTAAMATQMAALRDLTLAFDTAYTAEKRAQNILDFSDLEHMALAALADDAVCEDVRSAYPHVFVDEYQDISPIQDAILRRVSTPGAFFCVGDVKQSIYRFRSAEPRLFIDRLAQSSCDEDAAERRIDLSANFRSSAAVVNLVNFLFEHLMSERLGDVAYGPAERLVLGAPQPPVALPEANRLILIDNAGRGEEELTRLEELIQLEREATVVAGEIKRAVGSQIWNGKTGLFRPASYGDITVLLRAIRNVAPVYAEVLRRAGIPVYTEAESSFCEELEVQLAVNLLRLVDNGARDYELLSSLYSALGNFALHDLVEVRGLYPDGSFASAVERYSARETGDLADRLKDFLHKVSFWRAYARHADIEKLLYRIYDDTGFLEYAGTLPDGEARQANLRTLATLARGYAAGLYDFLQSLERLEAGGARTSRSGQALGAVTIMSVHKSKGLEFPVVIVGNLGKRINLMDTREDILLHGQLGLGPRCLNRERRTRGNTMAHEAIAVRGLADTLSEEMRMLYVALTRARERLILVGTMHDLSKKLPGWAMPLSPTMLRDRGRSWLDWIGSMAVRCEGPLRDALDHRPPALPAPAWACHVVPAQSIAADRPQRADRAAALRGLMDQLEDVRVSDELHEAYDWQYSYGDGSALPGKVSATSLLDKQRNWRGPIPAPEIRRKPAFLEEKTSYSATDRGTFAHTVLQLIPFDTKPEAVPGVVAALEERGLLPEQASQVIDLRWITGFLRSGIAARILRSPQVLRELPFNLSLPASEVFTRERDGALVAETSRESILVQGIIDCCFREGDHWVLLDYKTNRVDETHTAGDIATFYRPQLDVYAKALEQITGASVGEAYLYLLSVQQEVRVF